MNSEQNNNFHSVILGNWWGLNVSPGGRSVTGKAVARGTEDRADVLCCDHARLLVVLKGAGLLVLLSNMVPLVTTPGFK